MVPAEYVDDSESRRDGVSSDDEVMLRVYGCEIIQQAGQLLRLPQQACATAQVIFQRFYIKRSFVDFKVEFSAMAANTRSRSMRHARRAGGALCNWSRARSPNSANTPPAPLIR